MSVQEMAQAKSTSAVETVLASLTMEEKVSLLAGSSFWETTMIPGKSIPSVKLSDGPNGVRGAAMRGGPTSACFPCAVSLAATWNVDSVREVGKALAEEAKTKGVNLLLGPTVCPHRHPLGGRNFESFSEDPYLSGIMASAYINSLQDQGIGAAIKHFAANEQETFRNIVDVSVSMRALREIYLRPFEIAIRQAKPWAVMTAYNSVNGSHADCNEMLLRDVLRREWGWDGLVVSDWGGTTSLVESLDAGLDLEMPGPPTIRKPEAILRALGTGEISESLVDDRARAVLQLVARTTGFGPQPQGEEYTDDKIAHRQLIRRVGSEGIVLLKNEDDILPLQFSKPGDHTTKIALLGFADEALIHGGGSAAVNAHYRVTPAEGLKKALEHCNVEFECARGAHTLRKLPPMVDNVTTSDKKEGWSMEFLYCNSPATISCLKQPLYIPTVPGNDGLTIRATTTFCPPSSGRHYISLSGLGPSLLLINGTEIYKQTGNCPDLMAFILSSYADIPVQYDFVAWQSYHIEVVSHPLEAYNGPSFMNGRAGFSVGFLSQSEREADLLAEAVAIAARSDIVIVFTGNTAEWEAEGQDQISFHLPREGSQDRLVSAVAAANKNTIVVNCTGVPIAMPWVGEIKALVQAWFPGQEAGNSIADILVGECSPSGKLPVTFPRAIEDAPAFGNFPGGFEQDGRARVRYEEGVFVGYRSYDHGPEQREKVLFPFGYGLSYTSFTLHDISLSVSDYDHDDSIQVHVTVSNIANRRGTETIQVYVGNAHHSKEHPWKTLVAFTQVLLDPGESRATTVPFTRREFAHFDEASGRWVVEAGEYLVHVGTSVDDIADTEHFFVRDCVEFAP
ncbi:glycoside hydrolase superfamily [Aspergillus insuetus]